MTYMGGSPLPWSDMAAGMLTLTSSAAPYAHTPMAPQVCQQRYELPNGGDADRDVNKSRQSRFRSEDGGDEIEAQQSDKAPIQPSNYQQN
jgi:hypothetical protein